MGAISCGADRCATESQPFTPSRWHRRREPSRGSLKRLADEPPKSSSATFPASHAPTNSAPTSVDPHPRPRPGAPDGAGVRASTVTKVFVGRVKPGHQRLRVGRSETCTVRAWRPVDDARGGEAADPATFAHRARGPGAEKTRKSVSWLGMPAARSGTLSSFSRIMCLQTAMACQLSQPLMIAKTEIMMMLLSFWVVLAARGSGTWLVHSMRSIRLLTSMPKFLAEVQIES